MDCIQETQAHTYDAIISTFRQLAAVLDAHIQQGKIGSTVHWLVLNGTHDSHALQYLTKHNMLPIEVRSSISSNEKLGSISIWSCVRHG